MSKEKTKSYHRRILQSKNGRPSKTLDPKQFEACCAVLCTKKEIMSILDLGENTLNQKLREFYGAPFSVVYERFSNNARMSLRRKQFRLADTNSSMAIWLGKQQRWLGQSDVQRVEHTFIKKEDEIVQLENSYNRLEKKDIELEVEEIEVEKVEKLEDIEGIENIENIENIEVIEKSDS